MNLDTSERIAVLVERLGRLARALQHRDGTKPVQWEVLRYLARANRFSRNPGALADFLGSTRGTVSQTLITLEKKGLVSRIPSRFDGRGMELELTEAGRQLVDENPLREFEAAAAAVPCREELADGLCELLDELQKRKGYRGFGECCTCADLNVSGGKFECQRHNAPINEPESYMICCRHTPRRQMALRPLSAVAAG